MSNERLTRAWTLVLTSVAFFMVALDTLVVMTALPAIRRDLGASLATLEWTVNAFTLAFAAGITTAAALGDRSGRRRVFAIGLALFSASSAACALAPTAAILIAGRALQGAAAAMVMPLSLTILVAAFPLERRGAIVGIWGGIGGLAVASGPLVGGAITQGLDWHWIFWVNVPIGLVATALTLTRLVESRGPRTRLDFPAVALVSAGAVCVVWGLVRAGEAGWLDPKTIAALGIGVAALGGFLAWERRAADPMLPLHLFRSRPFTAAIGISFLMAGALTSAAFLISQYFQLALGYSPLSTGIRLLPWTATPLLVAPIAGQLSDRIGRRPILVAGMLLQGLGLGWFASLANAEVDYRRLVLPLIIAGVGVSMAMPVAPAAALSAVSRQDMGKASGVRSTLQRFGSAFGIAVAAAVFAAYGHLGSAAGFVAGFRPALTVAAGLSLLGATAALAIGPAPLAAVAAKPEAPAATVASQPHS